MPLFRLLGVLLLLLPTGARAQPPRLSSSAECAATARRPATFGCVNRSNLNAMVAEPTDLIQGRSHGRGVGALDAAAVDRLLTDRTKKLTGTTTDGSQPNAAPASPAPASPAPGGAPQ